MSDEKTLQRLRKGMKRAAAEAEPTELPPPSPVPPRTGRQKVVVGTDRRDNVGEESQAPDLSSGQLAQRISECRNLDELAEAQRWIDQANADSQIGWEELQILRKAVKTRSAELRAAG